MTIASRMLEIDFVMSNDGIVEIANIECSVRTELQVDRMKPPVVAGEKVLGLLDPRGRASPLRLISMDDIRYDVADKHRTGVLGRKVARRISDDPRDAGRAMIV